jgi:hypothetical protein
MTEQDYVKTWPARYKANMVEVHESHRHQIWIASAEVRKVIRSLKSDARLEQEHGADFRKLDRSRRVFFSERALRCELQTLRSNEALKFLAWLDKDIYYPAARKRGDAEPLKLMEKPPHAGRPEQDEDDEALHIPARKLPPPVRPPRQPSPAAQPRGVIRERVSSNPVMRAWRGEYDVWPTLLWGGLFMLAWTLAVWSALLWAVDPDNYNGSYRAKQWLVLCMLPAIPAGVMWWCVCVMRSVMRRQAEMRRLALGGVVFAACASILLNSLAFSGGIAREWLEGWIETVFDDLHTAQVIHDPILGRIVVRGDTGWGSYKALEAAINMKPKLTLVELEGPGGYVVEGMAMARLIMKHQLDTVVLGPCISACTLMMVAGKERYLGPRARLGFHRSGTDYVNVSTSWTRRDHQLADFYRVRGTSEDFVKRALDTPFNRIWLPGHGEVMASGYATRFWADRAPGY